jgi:xanthine dehydrogenase large subunit
MSTQHGPLADRPNNPVVGLEISHESADLHVTGTALYTQDLLGRTRDPLHAWPLQAQLAHARVTRLDVTPAYAVPGVVKVLTAEDVPGVNDAGEKHDEPLFPFEVMFSGHAVCWVLGETLDAARQGSEVIDVEYEPLPSLVSVRDAIAAESYQGHQRTVGRGDPDAAMEGWSSAARSTSTSRPTPLWPWSTRTARSSCSPAPSTRRRPRTSSPTSSESTPIR